MLMLTYGCVTHWTRQCSRSTVPKFPFFDYVETGMLTAHLLCVLNAMAMSCGVISWTFGKIKIIFLVIHFFQPQPSKPKVISSTNSFFIPNLLLLGQCLISLPKMFISNNSILIDKQTKRTASTVDDLGLQAAIHHTIRLVQSIIRNYCFFFVDVVVVVHLCHLWHRHQQQQFDGRWKLIPGKKCSIKIKK